MQLEYFRMVDRIVHLSPGDRVIRAEARVPEASPVFEGHFPGHPILPGVLMIETMAQTGGWLILALGRFASMAFLAQVKEAKMRSFVSPGALLETKATLLHDGSGYAVAKGRITSGGKPVADAEIVFRTMPFPKPELREMMVATARRIGFPEELIAA